MYRGHPFKCLFIKYSTQAEMITNFMSFCHFHGPGHQLLFLLELRHIRRKRRAGNEAELNRVTIAYIWMLSFRFKDLYARLLFVNV